MEEKKLEFSIIIPVYNEAQIIAETVTSLCDFLRQYCHYSYEIILVNDGSTDKTAEKMEELRNDHIKLVHHAYNKGYGAALKTGVRSAGFDKLVFYDGDGQHKPEDLLNLMQVAEGYDMVVGSRQGYKGPVWRQPGKVLINLLANYLVKFKIPDLNSGLRVVDKDKFLLFEHLYPNGFSLSTTITLSFIKHGLNVRYETIRINKRMGSKSTVSITDGFRVVNLVIRMIMLFAPLRIFLPFGAIIFTLGLISFLRDVFMVRNINDNTILLLISSLIFFFFGLIADQLASIRREMKL
jgi:glycosyltransferase involved in cell wall biosynthesis